MIPRVTVISNALLWEGTRYKHQGRDEFGLDCVGLIIKVAHQCGVTDYDTTNYPRRPNSHDFIREMKGQLTRLPKREIKSGDIIMFRSRGMPCHVGIKVSPEKFIHAYLPHKKVTVDPIEAYKHLIVCGWRYEGVED